jgi:hypothetical protein
VRVVRTDWILRPLLLGALVLLLGGCAQSNGAGGPEPRQGSGGFQTGGYNFADRPEDGRLQITAAEFGRDWPLTVEGGTLVCEGPSAVGAVYFETEGTRYGVNGLADGTEIRPIWKDAQHGLKKNIGPLIDIGLKICDG